MNGETLSAALRLLDEALTADRSDPVWLVVGGGSALLARHLGSRATRDVDVMALRGWDGEVINAYPLPEVVTHAASRVAVELGLVRDWLSSAASLHAFDLERLPGWFWQELETVEYGASLKVSFIGRRGLILLKLAAALGRDQRRDLEDLASLRPDAGETQECLRWILLNLHESHTHPKLPGLLHEIGHDDLVQRFP